MAIKRALTVQNVLDKIYKLFEFTGKWLEAFSKPERVGVWFIWGNSGNGKTTFILQLIKCLTGFEKVLFNSREEGTTHTLQKSFVNLGMSNVNNKLFVVDENIEDLTIRLQMKKSPRIVIIDSFQAMQINYDQYLDFKRLFPNKLIIFISQCSGKLPIGRPAEKVMFDATLKIWVEGYKAISKGRYIGETGEYVIWEKGAREYWG